MFRVETAELIVRITTIPSHGPFRLLQRVQFFCEVEPAQSDSITYQWRTVEHVDGGVGYSSESFYTIFPPHYLRYCWYFCSIIVNGTVLGSAEKLIEVHGKY